jgi:exopolysaccharide production protein ExoY
MSGVGWNRRHQASLRRGLASPFNRATKRIFDIVATVLLLAPLIPIFGIVSLAIKIDGGPIFSAHERRGVGRSSFRCLRFRTTICDSDTKPNDDPHVSTIGSFLRLTGVDALPQFINVLRGEMSLVGSGPGVQHETIENHNGVDWQNPIVRPGLTGLWRVWGGNRSSGALSASLDERYVQDWSLWSDISILVRSVPDIISGPRIFGPRIFGSRTAVPKSIDAPREQ